MLAGNRVTLDEPAGFGQETISTEEEEQQQDIGTEQDPESDSDDEQMKD